MLAGADADGAPEPLTTRKACAYLQASGGYDVMVACQLPKLNARVRFPLPAPSFQNLTKPARSALCFLVGLKQVGHQHSVDCHAGEVRIPDIEIGQRRLRDLHA